MESMAYKLTLSQQMSWSVAALQRAKLTHVEYAACKQGLTQFCVYSVASGFTVDVLE